VCVISFATAVYFCVCLCVFGQNVGHERLDDVSPLWRYDCTILMTCDDKSDVLHFLMSPFCQRSCIAFLLIGPVSFSLLCSRLRVAERDYTHICLLVMSQHQVIFFFGHIHVLYFSDCIWLGLAGLRSFIWDSVSIDSVYLCKFALAFSLALSLILRCLLLNWF
jgi:hypothetical protein